MYPYELEVLRNESINILETLLTHLKENPNSSQDLQWEREITNKTIIEFNWYEQLISELYI